MLTMKESVDAFQSYLWNQPAIVSAKTVNQYVSIFSRLLRFAGGKPKHLTQTVIKNYLRTLQSRVAVRQVRTVLNYASQLFPMIETLKEADWLHFHQRRRKTMTHRTPISSKAMLTRIYSVDHEVAQVMMLISLHTGCRMGALSNLTKSDYNSETKQLKLTEKGDKTIHYQLNEFTLIDRLETILTSAENDQVLLPMRTIQVICESIECQAHDFRRLYSKKIQNEYLKKGYSDDESLELTRDAMNHDHVDTTYGYANYDSITLTKRTKK